MNVLHCLLNILKIIVDVEEQKRLAATEAVLRFAHSGTRIGLGTGSTATYAIMGIAERHKSGLLNKLQCLSTSVSTSQLAERTNLPLQKMSELLDDRPLDLVIDGADAVDQKLNLIKGGGGALLREKIAAYNTQKMVVVIDEGKMVPCFDSNTPAIPIEVLPHAHNAILQTLEKEFRWKGAPLFSNVSMRVGIKSGLRGSAHFITDNGNMIIDAQLAVELNEVEKLEHELNHMAGVLENGLFTQCKPVVVVGSRRGLMQLTSEGLRALGPARS